MFDAIDRLGVRKQFPEGRRRAAEDAGELASELGGVFIPEGKRDLGDLLRRRENPHDGHAHHRSPAPVGRVQASVSSKQVAQICSGQTSLSSEFRRGKLAFRLGKLEQNGVQSRVAGGGRHQGLGNIVSHSLARAQHLKRWTHGAETKFRSAAWEGVKRDLRVEKQAYDSTRQASWRPDYADPPTDLGNPIVEWRRAYDPLIRPKLILKTRRACLHRRHPRLS